MESTVDKKDLLPTPDKLIDIGHGLWKASVLSSAIEFGIFDYLQTEDNRPKSLEEICAACGIKCLRPSDVLNALTQMGQITKDVPSGKYSNTPEATVYCVKSSPLFLGGMFLARANIGQSDFVNLSKYLRGEEIKRGFTSFEDFYNMFPDSNKSFAFYMQSSIKFVGLRIPEVISDVWKDMNSFMDVGGGSGYMTIQICKAQKHLKGINSDLAALDPVFKEYIEKEDPDV
jgi:hypothetical protein